MRADAQPEDVTRTFVPYIDSSIAYRGGLGGDCPDIDDMDPANGAVADFQARVCCGTPHCAWHAHPKQRHPPPNGC